MKRTGVALVIAVLTTAGLSTAATVWNPAANGIYPPDTGDWSTEANWTNDVPGVQDNKAVFNVPDAAECVISEPVSVNQLVQGDNGPGGLIRVIAGGSLETGAVWSSIGYNNTAHMVVETGGSVTFGQHMWVGLLDGAGTGTLDITGGSVRVTEMVGLGWNSGVGFVNVMEGLLDLQNIHPTDSIKEGSLLNIENGVVTIDGDHLGKVNDYIASGRIVGFGGAGTVTADFDETNPGKTTIAAVPEPATIALLGLGGLMLQRKRK